MTNVLLIGASAGGIEPLIDLIERLPADLPAPVLIVVHVPPDANSRLPDILQRKSELRVRHAADGEPLREGAVLVAPPDHHLMVEDGRVRVVRGPRQNRHRPAIDTLLRTAALAHDSDVVAVNLSGAAGDGVAGAMVVANRGGQVIVQDPDEALFDGMPRAVLRTVPGSQPVRTANIPDRIRAAFDGRPIDRKTGEWDVREREARREVTSMHPGTSQPPIDPGRPSYSCPDCGGVLEEVIDGGPLRFQCRVGHGFYADDLAVAQWTTLEDALWSAVRGMEENAELSSRLARIAEERGAALSAERHRDCGSELLAQSRVIRDFLVSPTEASERGEASGRRERQAS